MNRTTERQRTTIDFIKKSIEVLSGTVLLLIFIVLLLITKYLYSTLNYIPTVSAVALLVIVAALALMGLYLAKATSKKAIRAIDEYIEKLSALLETTKAIHELGYSDLLLERIMNFAVEITGAQGGALVLAENHGLVYKIVRGERSAGLKGRSIPNGKGIAGWVVGKGRPLRIDDARSDKRFHSDVDNVAGVETTSVLCVPLMLRDGAIGAIELVNKKNSPFTREDEDLLVHFASQAALSFEKARFYEDEKNYEIHLNNLLVEAIDGIAEKRGHSKRVAKYTLMMANALRMSEEQQKRLYTASLLHDIGFLKINLQEVSSASEYKSHSQLGYEILEPINFYADIAPLVLHHHERYDGFGYPSGLMGKNIPLESRMLCIAEAFDSMVSPASYKNVGRLISSDILPSVVDFNAAVKELRDNAGTQFDPELVEIFAKVVSGEDLA